MKNPVIEQLIDAQLDFLDREFNESKTVQDEFLNFYQWFRQQRLQDIWSFEKINHLLQKQILATPASNFLIEQIADHIRFAIVHPVNDETTIEDIIPVTTIDKIALYVASKSSHRKALIKKIVNNPSFSSMLTELIHHSIQDYVDNSVMNKKVPGVGRFMKMGKSVLETVTDTNLDDTVKHYLQKNIIKISQLSENVLNRNFDDNKLYHFQANLWHKVKTAPISNIKKYIEVNDLPKTVSLGHEIWEHLRQTDYLKKQVHDGVYAWYVRNQERNFDQILSDINIDQALVENELHQLLAPVIKTMISTDHLKTRARIYLEKFYYSDEVLSILKIES
ncbi:hypothetical protein [Acinetobacter gerneri]|jgi:hypothetical protein|uniref:Uncharacterized protein n=1 Tax=Acinetobacter gerneri DSM 14967 = CIP 107464 = MTCC 9824 TaxID=1120926 RepID=N8ZMR3_9GAMM|nr:hypothetical protein [Acinetobacter gerneri]ENV35024.1 hypothetical protein F960_00674 [Acinetobacter gerneri DSM 14967 = CIP 107464 = MTCC 9824]EPR82372.1 hypothetical protein L289_3020 [Acinetobacter gerneri DSM 14967 = CIP 107464 = MTCC 9824]MCH4245477.1 hypothetical protein [Acinetobacter gerneri]